MSHRTGSAIATTPNPEGLRIVYRRLVAETAGAVLWLQKGSSAAITLVCARKFTLMVERWLTGSGGVAASDVVGHVSYEQLFDLVGDRARGGCDFVASDFTNADDVAIGGGNEDFVGGVEIFRAKSLLDDVDAGFWSDLGKNSAGDAFEAAGV